jgi:hypothetical protein
MVGLPAARMSTRRVLLRSVGEKVVNAGLLCAADFSRQLKTRRRGWNSLKMPSSSIWKERMFLIRVWGVVAVVWTKMVRAMMLEASDKGSAI